MPSAIEEAGVELLTVSRGEPFFSQYTFGCGTPNGGVQRSSALRPASTDNEYGGDRKCFFRSVHGRPGWAFLIFVRKHEARVADETGQGQRVDSDEGVGHSAILGRVYKCRGSFIGRVSMLRTRAGPRYVGQER